MILPVLHPSPQKEKLYKCACVCAIVCVKGHDWILEYLLYKSIQWAIILLFSSHRCTESSNVPTEQSGFEDKQSNILLSCSLPSFGNLLQTLRENIVAAIKSLYFPCSLLSHGNLI